MTRVPIHMFWRLTCTLSPLSPIKPGLLWSFIMHNTQNWWMLSGKLEQNRQLIHVRPVTQLNSYCVHYVGVRENNYWRNVCSSIREHWAVVSARSMAGEHLLRYIAACLTTCMVIYSHIAEIITGRIDQHLSARNSVIAHYRSTCICCGTVSCN